MKRAIVYGLALLFVVSGFIFLVSTSPYLEARRSALECAEARETCRAYSMESGQGWVQTMMMLTACDVAWGWCNIAG